MAGVSNPGLECRLDRPPLAYLRPRRDHAQPFIIRPPGSGLTSHHLSHVSTAEKTPPVRRTTIGFTARRKPYRYSVRHPDGPHAGPAGRTSTGLLFTGYESTHNGGLSGSA